MTRPTTCCSTTWAPTSPCASDGLDDERRRVRRGRRRRPVHGPRRGASTIPSSRATPSGRSSFIATSGILPADQFQQFESWPAARYDKPGGPFDPHTGTQYVYSQIADVSYKRLTRRDRGTGGRRVADVLDVVRHRGRVGPPVRRGAHAGRRRLDDAAGRQRTHDRRRPARAAPAGLASTCTRSSPTTRRWTGSTRCTADRHQRRRLERGERQLGRLAAVEHRPRRRTPARPSRSRSPTPATGPPRASASSSTTSRCPTARAPRSRPASTAGRSPGRRRAAHPTATTSSAPTPRASRSAPRSPRRTRCCSASGWRAITTAAERNAVMGRALDHLLD